MKSRKRIKKKSGPTPAMRKNIPPDIPHNGVRDMAMIAGVYLVCLIILAGIAIGVGLYKRYSKASNKIEYHKKH